MMKPLTSIIIVIMAILLLTAVPIVASDASNSRGQSGRTNVPAETGQAAKARANAHLGLGVVASIDARRDLEHARRGFELPSGILNAQCVQSCIESTFAVSSHLLEEEKQGIKRQCMEKCRAEKEEQRKEQKQDQHEARETRKNIITNFTANFSAAMKNLQEQKKTLREEFKDFRDALKGKETRSENGSEENEETTNEDSEKQLTDEEKTKRREAKQELREKIDALREKQAELIDSLPSGLKKPRLIERGELIKLNRALDRSRENYALARQMHLESRKKIEEHKQQYNDCVKNKKTETDAETTDTQDEERQRCKETKHQFNADVKLFLVNTADVVIENLNKLKYQVKLSEDLTAEESDAMLAELEQRIIDVKNARANVEELKEDAPREELKAATKTIRDAWQDTNKLMKRHVSALTGAKLGNIIHRMDMLEQKFVNARDRLKERNADVSALDELLAKLNDTLGDAKKKYEDAVKMFAEAQAAQNVDSVAKEVQGLLKEARADLKTAQEQLRVVVQEIKVQLRATTAANATAAGEASAPSDTTGTTIAAEAPASASGDTAATAAN